MKTETLDEFVARGGKITQYPPGYGYEVGPRKSKVVEVTRIVNGKEQKIFVVRRPIQMRGR